MSDTGMTLYLQLILKRRNKYLNYFKSKLCSKEKWASAWKLYGFTYLARIDKNNNPVAIIEMYSSLTKNDWDKQLLAQGYILED